MRGSRAAAPTFGRRAAAARAGRAPPRMRGPRGAVPTLGRRASAEGRCGGTGNKRWTKRLRKRTCFQKDTAAFCQSLLKKQRRCKPLAWQCCQGPEKSTTAKYMNFFEQTQVLSSLAGVPRWETHPEIWEWLQAVPMLEKRQKGRATFKCLLRRPDSVPSGCGSWPGGRRSWRWHYLLQGCFLSVSPEEATGQAAALPHVLAFWPSEFCLVGQPIPKGQSVPLSTSTGGKQRTSWLYQRCCKLTSGAQDGLTSRFAPPDAVGETTTSLPNPQRTTSVLSSQDVQRRCTAATVVFLLLAVLLCSVVVWRRRKRKEHLSTASGAQLGTDACP
ncbi:uncharacterized protein [Ciconia boyciana]|uniref:uncharacterized protein isoform X1 n=1 Tax=Ciconia boyciana TaxID=52775 RepID=UPI003BA3AE16